MLSIQAHIQYLNQKKDMQESQIMNLIISNNIESTL